jgi:hypothetical protein
VALAQATIYAAERNKRRQEVENHLLLMSATSSSPPPVLDPRLLLLAGLDRTTTSAMLNTNNNLLFPSRVVPKISGSVLLACDPRYNTLLTSSGYHPYVNASSLPFSTLSTTTRFEGVDAAKWWSESLNDLSIAQPLSGLQQPQRQPQDGTGVSSPLQTKPIKTKKSAAKVIVEVRLPKGYQPHPFDVICRNDRERVDHVGNEFFLRQVQRHARAYARACSRTEKSDIIRDILRAVKLQGGRFIRQEQEPEQEEASHTNKKAKKRRGNGDDDEDDHSNDSNHEHSEVKYIYYDIGKRKASDKAGHAIRLAMSR